MKKWGKKLLGLLLCTIMIAGLLPGTLSLARADGKTITGLGTGAITNPAGNGSWSYVYFGKYNGNPVKYRVLSKNTNGFGGTTMLLDCNSILLTKKRFDDDSNVWANSEIRGWLNGDEFLGNTSCFTSAENEAIAVSSKDAPNDDDGSGWSSLGFAKLSEGDKKDRIFLLDAREATCSTYGYTDWGSELNYHWADDSRKKSGADIWWWLRSPYPDYDDRAGFVNSSGALRNIRVNTESVGVSPALNINLSSVIFSSLISGTAGSAEAEYKLTLLDSKMIIAEGSAGVSRSGNTITVPYEITGDNAINANQVSVLIMDSAYSAGTAATSGYTYLKLDVSSFGTTGTGTFTLPAAYADKTCGTDYYAYILAEDINNENATDYASAPTAITIPAAHTHSWTYSASGATITATCNGAGTCDITSGKTITISAPAAPLAYNGQPKAATLSTGYNTTAFPGAYTIRYQGTGGTTYDSTTAPSAAGTYQASITAGTATASVEYEIAKAAQAAPDVPAVESVTENSITLKKTDGYQYSIDGTNWQDSPVFTGLSPDTEYTFYQRIAGDANHETSPASVGTKIKAGSIFYTATEVTGDNQTAGENTDLTAHIVRNEDDQNKTFVSYTGSEMDGQLIPGKYITKAPGSLLLTISKAYMETLAAGDHTLKVYFQDGSVEVPVKIKAAAPTPRPVPKTLDNSSPALWIGLILTGIAGLAVLTVMKASRNRK